jgi:predicted DNA-binding protein YlxM (UPF0122 family)
MGDIFEGVDRCGLDGRLARDVKFYLCRQYTSEKLKEIADRFNLTESAVSHAARRVSKMIATDAKMHQKIEQIAKDLGFQDSRPDPL